MTRVPVKYLPGDILAFSSQGLIGAVINLATWGIPGWGASHVAMIGREGGYGKRLVLWESLGMPNEPCLIRGKVVTGVQVQDITNRIKNYKGRVWHYPLTQPLDSEQVWDLDRFCMQYLGTDYDTLGAFRSRGLSLIEKVIFRPADLTSVFCSEFCAAAHHHLGIFTKNASRMNPNRFIRCECAAGVLAKSRRKK